MILVVYLVLMLALFAALIIGPRIRRRSGRSAAAVPPPIAPPAPSETGGGVDVLDDDDAELAEALLANQLLTGALPSGTYRHQMAALAAEDALRHPLIPPPERGT